MIDNNSSMSCPCCYSEDIWVFYEIDTIPVHSVVLLKNIKEAINYPTGEIRLGFCRQCGFITNLAYDFSLQDYSCQYESTQAYSPTFNKFAQSLAARMVDQYGLYAKTIIEIGCGQGEFLALLCNLGNNHGIGFDPAYDPVRTLTEGNRNVEIIRDYYSEKYVGYQADFILCKMTLEHIHDSQVFINTVRRSIHPQSDPIIFFQVPDVTRILDENAFWDIYYEHCSYFSPGSLGRLFQRCGFHVAELQREYDDQYIMIEASINPLPCAKHLHLFDDPDKLSDQVMKFVLACEDHIKSWQNRLVEYRNSNKKVVLWGGGSKAVAFLSTLRIKDVVTHVVDINPKKCCTYLPTYGQRIISPSQLRALTPDVIIVMNPIYLSEVRAEIDKMNLNVELLAL